MPDQYPSDTALLIVDVQRGFIRETTEHVAGQVEDLQHKYKHVFVSQFYNDNPSSFRKLIQWDKIELNSRDFELAFRPKIGAIFLYKSIYSCISREFINSVIQRDIKSIHVCGIDTEICVLKCAVDIFEYGLVPYVLKDACASTHGNERHKAALDILGRFIGKSQIL